MAIRLGRFDGGKVDFLSKFDLGENQAQDVQNMRGERITRLVKRMGEGDRTATIPSLQTTPGAGYMQFRSGWNQDPTPLQASSLYRVITQVDVFGGGTMSMRINNTINDDIGGLTEFLTTEWTLRAVEGASDISFSGNQITKSSGFDVFLPGDTIRIIATANNNRYITVVSASATTIVTEESLTTEANTSAIMTTMPIVSMYAVNGVLRLSDGNFANTAPSKWYGHIKRDFWGQGVTYGSAGGRFSQPPMKEAYNDWKLQNQELVTPTIVAGARTGQATSAANEIAIHIAGTHPANWPDKAVDAEWNARDRVAFTYVYDFVQESELSRASSGEIGLPMGTIVTAADARAFMIEVYTGASNASWNRRITAIRMYYQFHDNMDWYEVVTLNINKGWSESVLVFDPENTGYWIPIVDGNGMDHSDTTDAAGGSGTTVESDAHGVLTTDMLYVLNKTTIEPGSLITKPSSVVANTMTLPVAMVDSLGVNPANYNLLDWCAGDVSATAVATFYIPFTGEKAYTYDTNTGRAVKVKVPAVRWRASASDGNLSLIGNIDTIDENGQTVREHSRVIEMSAGMPDTALLTNSKDVGIEEGDEIVSIVSIGNDWWVIKDKNIHVLRKRSLQTVHEYANIGGKWVNSYVYTPYGLCVADEAGIMLLPSKEEISFPIRDTYQGLTFFNPTLGYSHKHKELYFIADTSGGGVNVYSFSFPNKSWSVDSMPTHTTLSNFVTGEYRDPEIVIEGGVAVLTDLATNASDWTGATGTTPPDNWTKDDSDDPDSATFTITDLSAVTNFDNKTLVIVSPTGANKTVELQNINITYDLDVSYRLVCYYRSDVAAGATTPTLAAGAGMASVAFSHTGLSGDAVKIERDFLGQGESTALTIQSVTTNGAAAQSTLQIDDIRIFKTAEIVVSQFNKTTNADNGIWRTKEYILGSTRNKASIKAGYLSYISTGQEVTVSAYLDGGAIAIKPIVLPASSTLVTKRLPFNVEFKYISFKFESTAVDFEIELFEVPDVEINILDR